MKDREKESVRFGFGKEGERDAGRVNGRESE